MRQLSISWVALCALTFLSGCSTLTMSTPQPNIENTQATRSLKAEPMAVGKFIIAPDKDASMDQGISIRTNTLQSPEQNSFAAYLGKTLKVELETAGLLNENSTTVISADLLDSRLEAPIGKSAASLSARFKVDRNGSNVFQKVLSVSDEWDSPFIGAIAIPAAIGRYENLHKKLVNQLLTDEVFRAAVTAR